MITLTCIAKQTEFTRISSLTYSCRHDYLSVCLFSPSLFSRSPQFQFLVFLHSFFYCITLIHLVKKTVTLVHPAHISPDVSEDWWLLFCFCSWMRLVFMFSLSQHMPHLFFVIVKCLLHRHRFPSVSKKIEKLFRVSESSYVFPSFVYVFVVYEESSATFKREEEAESDFSISCAFNCNQQSFSLPKNLFPCSSFLILI